MDSKSIKLPNIILLIHLNIEIKRLDKCSDGSGSKIFDPGRVVSIFSGLGQPGSGWVSHLWFGFGFGKFPLKTSNFSIFSLWVKKNLLGSGQKVPGSRAGWLLFTAWVGSGPSLWQ